MLNNLISDKQKKAVLAWADTTLGGFAFGALVVCFIILLNYALLRIAG